MYKSDAFIVYDDVQYDKEGWRNRNRIKTANGVQWLTIPVLLRFEAHPLICEVKIDNKVNWRKKHLLSIRQSYSKAPYFKKYIEIFDEAFSREWDYLADIDMHLILKLAECLGMADKKIIRSSTLNTEKAGTGIDTGIGKGIGIGKGTGKETGIGEEGKGIDSSNKMERLVRICKVFEADTFYEGAAGRNYIDDNYFAGHGIKMEYQDYKHPVYSQLYGEFVPYLSVIDLLFNHGDESLNIITNR